MFPKEDFAEFVGIVIGDGNIYDRGPTYVEICGDPVLDAEFMSGICPKLESLGFKPKMKIRYGGLRLRINNKNLVKELKLIGLPAGSEKCTESQIPKIFLSDWELTRKCIKGIFDTDGCIFYDKRSVYKTPYVRICLHMKNKKLLKQIQGILLSKSIDAKVNTHGYNLSINGRTEVNKFLQNVGFSNKRHMDRIKPQ